MVRADFNKLVAEKAGITIKEATAVTRAYEEVIMEEVFAKEDSLHTLLGTFSGYTKETPAHEGRNPATGETIHVPAKTVHGYPKFKASKAAKE